MKAKEPANVKAQLQRAARACARDGAQFTDLRRIVLTLILEADGPLTAYQLLDRLKQTHKKAAPPTVYRPLDFLLQQRLIHKIERLNAFIPCVETRHDHPVQFLICHECGKVTEIDDPAVSKVINGAAKQAGFDVENAVVEVEGCCAACRHPERDKPKPRPASLA
jgi:Fur family transcriptional regulator, zinc uptake regulator